jgi:hypothetical protein
MGLDPLLAAPEGTPTVQVGLALEVGGSRGWPHRVQGSPWPSDRAPCNPSTHLRPLGKLLLFCVTRRLTRGCPSTPPPAPARASGSCHSPAVQPVRCCTPNNKARPSSFRPTKGCDMGSGYTGLLIYCNTVFFVSAFTVLLTSLFAVFLVCGHTGLLIAPRASCVS